MPSPGEPGCTEVTVCTNTYSRIFWADGKPVLHVPHEMSDQKGYNFLKHTLKINSSLHMMLILPMLDARELSSRRTFFVKHIAESNSGLE